MPTTLLASPCLGADYSFARPDPGALARAGVRFVSRYLAFLPNAKVVTAAERDRLWAAGIGLLLNWEQSEGDFLQPEKGARHGAEAARQALELGYPTSLPILVSCDREASPSEFGRAEAYFRAFADAAQGYPLGAYAQSDLANHLAAAGLVSVVWAPMATSWNHGVAYHRVDFRQFRNSANRWPALEGFGDSIDVNVSERPLDVWVPRGDDGPGEPVVRVVENDLDPGVAPVVHERDDWLEGYEAAPGEGGAWWGGRPFPDPAAITNITWHYPGGRSRPDPRDELRTMQAQYHRRTDADPNGRPAPFSRGYNIGYNAVVDLDGHVWKARWTDQRCAANQRPGNDESFAVQFMTAEIDDDLTPAQVSTARWLDRELRRRFPNIRPGVAGHKGHRDWIKTSCPGDLIYGRHVLTGNLLWVEPAVSTRQTGQTDQTDQTDEDDEDMRFRYFKATGFHDLLAVGPGLPFNPGSPEAAQELIDRGQVAGPAGEPVPPATDYRTVPVEVSVALWTAMNGGHGPTAPEA